MKVQASEIKYPINTEFGDIFLHSHEVRDGDGNVLFRSARDFYPGLQPKEAFRSARYKDLQYFIVTLCSFRNSAALLNRIRIQDKGAKATTIRNQVEREGEKIAQEKTELAKKAFAENGSFDENGFKKPDVKIEMSEAMKQTAEEKDVRKAMIEFGVCSEVSGYEKPGTAVNISIDEVTCKHQTNTRPYVGDSSKAQKQVRNTVIHVEKGKDSYIIVGVNMKDAVFQLCGFLVAEDLIGTCPITFYGDGARNISNMVSAYFGYLDYRFFLDWPHLVKRLSEDLSSSISGGKDKRNEILDKLKARLWLGDVSAAIELLDSIPAKFIKPDASLNKIKEYLNNRRSIIPCYAIRQKLGLRISSNRVEKSNDLAVSSRQKNNGMAWSNEGSFGLASISVASLNNEITDWVYNRKMELKFNAKAAA